MSIAVKLAVTLGEGKEGKAVSPQLNGVAGRELWSQNPRTVSQSLTDASINCFLIDMEGNRAGYMVMGLLWACWEFVPSSAD